MLVFIGKNVFDLPARKEIQAVADDLGNRGPGNRRAGLGRRPGQGRQLITVNRQFLGVFRLAGMAAAQALGVDAGLGETEITGLAMVVIHRFLIIQTDKLQFLAAFWTNQFILAAELLDRSDMTTGKMVEHRSFDDVDRGTFRTDLAVVDPVIKAYRAPAQAVGHLALEETKISQNLQHHWHPVLLAQHIGDRRIGMADRRRDVQHRFDGLNLVLDEFRQQSGHRLPGESRLDLFWMADDQTAQARTDLKPGEWRHHQVGNPLAHRPFLGVVVRLLEHAQQGNPQARRNQGGGRRIDAVGNDQHHRIRLFLGHLAQRLAAGLAGHRKGFRIKHGANRGDIGSVQSSDDDSHRQLGRNHFL